MEEGEPARLERRGRGSERGGGLLDGAWLGAAGVGEEGLVGPDVGRRAEGEEEGLGLAGGEAVALRGVGEPDLFAGGEGAEPHRKGEGQGAGVEASGKGSRELSGEGEAPLHPLFFAEEKAGRLGRPEAVLLDERRDDARFVHGADRLGRVVGLEDARLGGRAGDVLHDDGDLGASFVLPASEALETVQDFIGAVRRGADADRQRGELLPGVRARAAEGGEARAHGGDRDVADMGHGRLPEIRRVP